MTIPEQNHIMKMTDKATLNHRWTQISERLRSMVGRGMAVV